MKSLTLLGPPKWSTLRICPLYREYTYSTLTRKLLNLGKHCWLYRDYLLYGESFSERLHSIIFSDVTDWQEWEKCPGECGYNITFRSRICENYFMTRSQERNKTFIPDDKPCGDVEIKDHTSCHVGVPCVGKLILN